MPLGIEDTWVDGLEAYVLVKADAQSTARCFGKPVTWWPREEPAQPDHFWLCRQHEVQGDSPRKSIMGYVGQEPDLDWSLVQSGQSNGDVWAEDDDYHRPMYEDALGALSLTVPKGPERYESPVRVAARLSRELGTQAVAIWGSDEECALEGICLLENGRFVWAASSYSREEVERFKKIHDEDGDFPEDWENERHDSFFLYRPDQDPENVQRNLQEWADEQARSIGAGLVFGVSPHNLYPDDFPKCGQWLDHFLVALKED